MNIAYGEVLETLGYALLPVIEKFVDVIVTKVLPQLEAWINANKDKLAASLDTILTKLPALIIQVFDLFNYIQRNLGTIQVLGALLVSTFAAAKVYAGVIALSGAINVLTAAFGRQAAAATAAGTATAFATGGASALAAAAALTVFATASLVTYKQLTKNNKELTKTEKTTTAIAKDYGKVVGSTGKVLGNTTKLTAEQKKQLASQEALNKLKAFGVTPTSETNPIQLEAVRLNLLKEQNLAQQKMYDQLLANYNATERMNIASQRYADILTVIADSKISEEEVNLLAAKWNLTNIEVLKYIASVTGNVSLGSGWDAAGYAAGESWKKALEELNKYLAAVGKGAFVAPQFVPGGGGPGAGTTSTDLADKIIKDFEKAAATVPTPQELATREYRAGERNPIMANPQTILPGYKDYRAGERASSPNVNITVNGSVTSSNDLTETVRNGILAGQTSGRSITARVLDL